MRWRKWVLLGGLSAAALALAAQRLYARRPRGRVPGQEGLEDPEVTEAYQQISRLPQMRLMRWFVARRATRNIKQGLALDLGCGPGLLSLELARRAPELNVLGVDLSSEMLSRAEAGARQAGLGSRVTFRLGDAQEIPCPDASLDLVVSTLSLHHWSEPRAVMDEIARVLRPGGAFLIVDLRRNLSLPAWMVIWFATQVVAPPALRRINEPLASRDAAYTPEEVAGLLSESILEGWRVGIGPLWLTVEGVKGRVC